MSKLHIHLHKAAATKDVWPNYIDSTIADFERRFKNPENRTSPLIISGTIHQFNILMYELEKVYKSSKSTPEEKKKAEKLGNDLNRKYTTELKRMDKEATAHFKKNKG